MIKIDWALGYGNQPRIILEESLDLTPREDTEFEFKEGMWWNIQTNGLVRYFHHQGGDDNAGGFGGATFKFLHKGEPCQVRGPWSSRASWLNTLLPEEQQIADIVLHNGKQYPISIGILISELVSRWDQDAYLLRSLGKVPTGEHGGVTASLAPNCILKPDNSRYDPANDYQIFAEPKGVE
jgi:hypothetical protein